MKVEENYMKKYLLLLLLSSIILALLPAGEITSSSIVTKTANHSLNAKWLGGIITDSSGYNFNGKTGINHTLTWNNHGNITPSSSSINWFVNGSNVGSGTTYTLNKNTAGTYTIKCRVSSNGFNFETSQNYVIKTKPYLQASIIGGSCSSISSSTSMANLFYYVSYMNGTYYMINQSYRYLFSSSDGINWTRIGSTYAEFTSTRAWRDWTKSFACGNGKFVFINWSQDKLYYSTNGTTWYASSNFSSVTGISSSDHKGCNLYYLNGKFYACVEYGYNVYESTDGNTWKVSFSSPTYSPKILMYSDGKYVLLGYNSSYAYISTNLTNWSSQYLNNYDGCWVVDGIGLPGGKFVYVNQNTRTMYVTDDLKTWTTCSCATAQSLTTDGTSIVVSVRDDYYNVSSKYTFYYQ